MRKNLLSRLLLRKDPKKPSLQETVRRVREAFDRLADNPAITWESAAQRELGLIGGILSHGEGSMVIALAALPTLTTLSSLSPEEAICQGRLAWKHMTECLALEIQKLGHQGTSDNIRSHNTLFISKGTHNAHRN